MLTTRELGDRAMRTSLICATLLLTVACGASRSKDEAVAPHVVEKRHRAMGAEADITAWTVDEAAATRAFDEGFAEIDRLEDLMSVWRPGSDLVRLNEAAGRTPVVVSPEVFEALQRAREDGDLTHGAFDVTFAALADIWKFDHDQDNRIPAPDEIRARLPLIDYRKLTLDAAARTAYLPRSGMKAHLGGIGKGYTIDRVASMLRSRGLRNFMIQFGGDLYVAGMRGPRPWHLAIQDPRGPAGDYFAAIELSDSSFSTSGDYERFFMRDGRRYHHIIDTRTGQPAQGCRSVTIVAKNATLADALSTGVFVMGPAEGMALIERLPDVEGVIVSSDNRVLVSSGLKDRLQILKTPTDAP
jgi:thiamine biosynthesis lipoprotein